MAIDDVSFINLRGEEISRSNLVEQMINYYKMKSQFNETKLTDFSEGSEIRNLLESFAVDIFYLMEMETEILKNAFIDTATGTWLDKIGLHPFVQLARNMGSASKGYVTFSIPSESTYDIVIPKSTVLLGDNNLYYTTDSECVIAIGETENNVNITCATTGRDGNCESGTINKISESSYVNKDFVSVTNSDKIAGGMDYEEDEIYRERLLNFVRRDDFGSMGYYKALAEGVDGVHDVVLIDDENYTKKILVNSTEKPVSMYILLNVLAKFTDLNNTVIGHTFIVDTVEYISVDLDINITVRNNMDTTIIENVLRDFFDGGSSVEGLTYSGLNINQNVNEKELYDLFSIFDNIVEITIESDGENVTNIICPTNHVLTLGNVSITQNEVQ